MVEVFIQNERGSTHKNLHDEKTLTYRSTVRVSRPYPFPYGFILGTTSGDGDNLDCFVLTTRRLTTGTIIECEPLGLLEQIEDGEEDHNVLAAPSDERVASLEDAVTQLRAFIAHLFDHVPGRPHVRREPHRDQCLSGRDQTSRRRSGARVESRRGKDGRW